MAERTRSVVKAVPIVGAVPNPAPMDPENPFGHVGKLGLETFNTDAGPIEGTTVPVTAFVSGDHEEVVGFTDKGAPMMGLVSYSVDVVTAGAGTFVGRDVFKNHDVRDVDAIVGRILTSRALSDDETGRARIAQKLFITDPRMRNKLRRGEVKEVSIGFRLREEFDIDEETGEASNFRVVEMIGDHIGLVSQGAVSTGDGAGVGVGVTLGDVDKSAASPEPVREAIHEYDPLDATEKQDDNDQPGPPRVKEALTMSEDTDTQTPQADAEAALKMRELELKLAEAQKERDAARDVAAAEAEAVKARLAEYEQKEREALVEKIAARTGKDASEFADDDTEFLRRYLAVAPEVQQTSFAPASDDASVKETTEREAGPSLMWKNGIMVADGQPIYGGQFEVAIGNVTEKGSLEPNADAVKIMADATSGVLKGFEMRAAQDPVLSPQINAKKGA